MWMSSSLKGCKYKIKYHLIGGVCGGFNQIHPHVQKVRAKISLFYAKWGCGILDICKSPFPSGAIFIRSLFVFFGELPFVYFVLV